MFQQQNNTSKQLNKNKLILIYITMNTKKLSFAFELPTTDIDPNNFYKKGILEEILKIRKEYPGFTVSGVDRPDVKRGVDYASNSNLITVGTSKTHDIEWVERPNYAREKGYAPILDIRKDWNKIVTRLRAYAEEHHGTKTVGLSSGVTAIVHRNYVQIGYDLISYSDYASRVLGVKVKLSPEDVKKLYHALK